jgi:hypothetical protein
MCQPSWPIVLTILSALLAGCATSSIEMAPDQPDRPWVPATNAAGEIIPGAKARPSKLPVQPMYFPPIPSLQWFRLHSRSTVPGHILWRI